eukprot:CAMPEP_0179212034 /NCGR_PEP_ID=MMETSP0797-20121207/848_1 /TAXON_ID=47934 /ORGANISM="Dinophysis acuminata, Strain DAEP01" /LENGTH=62 /DNA_ID=CAMNT_0020917535 /DNA_START=72 /DNA_END=256 /DNA_ORIENTATION=-
MLLPQGNTLTVPAKPVARLGASCTGACRPAARQNWRRACRDQIGRRPAKMARIAGAKLVVSG